MHVTELAIYPIKSTGQISLQEAVISPTGFQHDRRWLLVDDQGCFITQRQYPELVRVKAQPVATGLLVQTEDKNDLEVSFPKDGESTAAVMVWKDECQAVDAGDEAARWFTGYLNKSCRLVYQPDDSIRTVDQRYAEPLDRTGFVDGFPFLLTSEGSLADLNGRLEHFVPMKRFRPNIVINNTEAFAEDHWKLIQIGEVTFRVAKPSSRCVMTTVDTESGVKTGKDPLKTLAGYRRTDMGVIFGQNLIHNQQGVIRVGDEVRVLG